MALSDEQRSSFISLLVSNVPSNAFIDVVREQGVVTDYDDLRKNAPEDLTEARRFLATAVIDKYNSRGRIAQLASGLYRRVYLDDYLAPKLAAYAVDSPPLVDDAAKQAAIARRANTMSSRRLREFLSENEPRICIVMAGDDRPGAQAPLRLGTGFLVGPDSVLTAYHTLAKHISDGRVVDPSPGRCCVVFDYYEGDALGSFDDIPASCLAVDFATDWLIASKEDMPSDGLFRDPDAQQLQLLTTRLDFALIRLSQSAGKQTRQRAGGARRSWIRIAPPELPLRDDDRIIIPQHPNGFHQRIDFGRFSQQDSAFDLSNTRLRYNTETDPGTSGAPCFDHRFALVGMHNAEFRPTKKNQAIRIELIHAVIAAVPNRDDADAASVRLWNTATGEEPRVILGRATLLDWLERAADETTETRQRVYAATVKPEDRANNSGFGKTFTTEILTAARRGKAEPIVLLGSDRDSLPDSVSDLVRAIAFQLGIDKAFVDTMPPRPSSDLPSQAPNADKLRRWASHDVPTWFDSVIGQWGEQEFDEVADARQRVQFAQAHNQLPSPQDVELAREATPRLSVRRRWPIAWIAIHVGNVTVNHEVQDLLAGLMGAKFTEGSVPPQLRRLRWLFIGHTPDFLSADQYTVEELNPLWVGTNEILDAIRCLADSMAFEVENDVLEFAANLVHAQVALPPPAGHPAAADPTKRLAYLQRVMFPLLHQILKGQVTR